MIRFSHKYLKNLIESIFNKINFNASSKPAKIQNKFFQINNKWVRFNLDLQDIYIMTHKIVVGHFKIELY